MEKMLLNGVDTLIKPVDQLALIGADHTLAHALLLMTKNKYSVVPVVDQQTRMCGLISMPIIMEAIMGIEDVEFDKLGDIRVREVLDVNYPRTAEDYELEDVLRMLVTTSFVSVVNKEGMLVGIITREEILRGTNRIVHNFEKKYNLEESLLL